MIIFSYLTIFEINSAWRNRPEAMPSRFSDFDFKKSKIRWTRVRNYWKECNSIFTRNDLSNKSFISKCARRGTLMNVRRISSKWTLFDSQFRLKYVRTEYGLQLFGTSVYPICYLLVMLLVMPIILSSLKVRSWCPINFNFNLWLQEEP